MSAKTSHRNLSEHVPAQKDAAVLDFPSRPGDPPSRLGARVRIEGVVVGRRKYGVNVRLPDGTIQSFSDRAVSPVEPESPGYFWTGPSSPYQ